MFREQVDAMKEALRHHGGDPDGSESACTTVAIDADATFGPVLTKFSDFLERSGGKIIAVLSLAGGVIGMASGRFTLGQVAIPVTVGIGVGTGVPIVTSTVTASLASHLPGLAAFAPMGARSAPRRSPRSAPLPMRPPRTAGTARR